MPGILDSEGQILLLRKSDRLGDVFDTESLDQQSRVPGVFGPERYARVRRIKQQYDPGNLFRLDLNIPPA